MTDKILRWTNIALLIPITLLGILWAAAWITGNHDTRNATYAVMSPFIIGWFWTALTLTTRERDRAYELIGRCERKHGRRHV